MPRDAPLSLTDDLIDNGIFPSGMPASKGILNDEEIWQIVVYLRHRPPKGSLGEPAVMAARDASRLLSRARRPHQKKNCPQTHPQWCSGLRFDTPDPGTSAGDRYS